MNFATRTSRSKAPPSQKATPSEKQKCTIAGRVSVKPTVPKIVGGYDGVPSCDNFGRTIISQTATPVEDKLAAEQNRILLAEVIRLQKILDCHGISIDGEVLTERTSKPETIA